MPSPTGEAAVRAQAAKRAVRERVWQLLERSGVALPPGAYGRIPMFEGADAAADRLTGLPEWQAARVVKANPDWAQMPVRAKALAAGKLLYMAVPRLAGEYPFVMLDPTQLPAPVEEAGDKDRALQLGQPVQVEEIRTADLAVAGSVAVNASGARVGKGGGFSDIEVALLTEAGVIGPRTTIVTTVHPLQVIDELLPETLHDFRVDVIVTPEEVIRATGPRPSPGIIWGALFLTSDALLALAKFGDLHLPAHESPVMAAYQCSGAARRVTARAGSPPHAPNRDKIGVALSKAAKRIAVLRRHLDQDAKRGRLVHATRCELRWQSLSAGKFSAQFALSLALKDVHLVLQAAGDGRFADPCASAAIRERARGRALGGCVRLRPQARANYTTL